MRVYWLSLLPLAGALVVALLRQRRVPMLAAVMAALLGYLRLCSALPLGQAETFLTQSWMLDSGAQHLLILACWATALLLAITAADPRADGVHAPLLASLGLLSAGVLLRSWLLAMLLLPAALIVPVLATLPADRNAPRGAAFFLAGVTAPVPFLLGIPWLLDQLAVHPQEVAVVAWSAWLLLPAWILWLNLFPFSGAMPLWAAGGEPLGPAFLWVVTDGVVIYLLLGLWRQMPALQTEGVLSTLRTVGLLTALFSGIWAVIQSHLSGVLGCAAMAVLGLVVQGLAAGSADSLSTALSVLLYRSAAVLMVTAALAALHGSSAGRIQASSRRLLRDSPEGQVSGLQPALQAEHGPLPMERRTVVRGEPEAEKAGRWSFAADLPWQGLVLWLISIAGVLALLRLPVMVDSASGQSLLEMLLALPGEPRLGQAWRISSLGILIGLAHTSWRLWRERVRSSAGRIRLLPLLLAVGLLLLYVYLARSPQVVASWVSGLLP